MAVDLETMRTLLQLDARNFSAGIDSATKKVSGFRGWLGSASATAAGFLGANVIQRGFDVFKNNIGGIISAGSDLNETISKTTVVFGDSFGEIDKWAKGSAKSFGLSRQEAFDTVSTFGAMATAAGLGGDAVVDFGTDLVKASADLGSFWNFDPSQVAEDIRSGLSGEAEPLRKYNIYLNEAAVKAKALEMGLVGSNGELSDENKVLARKALIMEKLGPAAGDYARTQKGLANGTRTLTAYGKNFQVWLGGKLVPTLARSVAWTNMFIARFIRLREAGLSPVQAALKAIRIQIYQSFGRGVLDVVNAIAHAFVRGFGLARSAIGAVTGEVGKWVKVMGWAFSSGLKVSSLVYAFPKPLREVARGFLLMADAVGDAFNALRSNGFDGLLEQLPDTLGQIWQGLTTLGGVAIDFAIDTAVSIGGWLWEHRGDIWGGIKAAVGWTVSTFSDAVSIALDGALSLAGDLAAAAGNLWGWIRGQLLGGASGSSATGADAAIGSQSIPIGTVLLDGLLGLGSYLAGVAADFGTWLWPRIKSGWNGALLVGNVTLNGALVLADGFLDLPWGDYADTVLASAKSAFGQVNWGSVWDSITSFATGLWEKFENFDYNNAGFIVGQGLRGAIEAIGPTLVTLAGDMLTFFWDGLQANWPTILKWFALWPFLIPAAIAGATAVLAPKAWEFLKGFLDGLGLNWDTQVKPWFVALPGQALEAIGDAASTLSQKGKDLVQGLWTGASDRWTAVYAWIGGRGQAAIDGLGDLSSTLSTKGSNLIEGFWDGMGDQWEYVIEWLGGLGSDIVDWVGDLSGILWGAGTDAIQGLIDGAQSRVPGLQAVVDTLKGIWEQIPLLGNSPWPMMIGAGQDAVDGLVIGGESRMGRLDAMVGRAIGAFSSASPAFNSVAARLAVPSALDGPTDGAINRRLQAAGGGGINQYYMLDGAIVTKDTWQTIQDAVALGKGKAIDRGISSRRLQESF